MKIFLVRHGESENNVGINKGKDSSLTKKGKRQAECFGKNLKKQKINIDYIYSSNLKRSKQTAETISKIIKVPIKESFEGLNEYKSKYLRRKLSASFNARIRKLKKFLKEMSKDKEKDETVLIVAHGITNRIIIGYFMKFPLRKQLLRFKQHNTGLSILEWNEKYKSWNLKFMNDINHLPEKLK
jgi:phosphohistidine phosphatase SixA